jgi:hypothetical protein
VTATSRSPLARHGLALLLYVALAVASFVPQSLDPAHAVAYVGDSLESVYIVAWNVHAALASPWRLFDANVLHPHPRALAFTDHRLLPSLLVAPVIWATGNAVLAYNVALLLACLLAAFAARRLARLLGADGVAAWAAGALYAFHTYQVNEGPRLNIVCHGFVPLALAELLLFLRGGKRRHAWTAAGFLLLQGLSSSYHVLYGSALLALITAAAVAARPRETAGRLPTLLLAGGAAALGLLPVALPYLANARAQGYARELPAGVDLGHYLSTAPTNLLYGPLGLEVRRQQQGPHFVGFVSLALVMVALLAWARRRGGERDDALLPARIWVPAAALLAALLVVLSLGRDIAVFGHLAGPGPYRLLHRFVPGFQLVRIPERLGLLAMLFVALLAARGLGLIGRRRPAAAALLAVLVPLEHISPLPYVDRVPVGPRVPRVYRWLAGAPVSALAEVPTRGEGLVREETLEMYFSTSHFRPLIHGYTAYPPLLTRMLRRMAARFPTEAGLQALQRAGVDTVVVHHGRPVGVDLRHQRSDRAEAEDDRLPALLREAGLDLYARLPAAVSAGRITLLARFEGTSAALFQSRADEVYRIAPAPAQPAAPFPAGRRRLGHAWRYRTKAGDPGPAADGDLQTAWEVRRPLRGDEFFEIVFDAPIGLSGVVLPLRRDSAFPTVFRLAGRDGQGRWQELARFDDAHALQLIDRLLADPRSAAIGFDLGGRELFGVSLLVAEEGTSFEGWSLPEVEVRVP